MTFSNLTFIEVHGSYSLVLKGKDVGILCKLCQRISYNPNDVKNRYCGNCHRFHGDANAR
jgi:hypothetical protein